VRLSRSAKIGKADLLQRSKIQSNSGRIEAST
jgi:hypothetical protein